MTTYTAIASTELDADSPVTDTLMARLDANPRAMFDGASGAPRLYGQGVARLGNGLATLTIAAGSAQPVNYGLASVVGALLTVSGTDVAAQTYTMTHYTGAATFNASHHDATPGGWTSTLSIFLNGALQSSFTTTSATPVARSVNVTFVAGDVIEWRHKINGGFGSQISALKVTATDAYVPQPVLIPASQI